jgi:hypothetical protein
MPTLAERFESKFMPEPNSGCWLWTGATLPNGCRVRCCVNPNHLEPVTRKENLLRGIGKTSARTHCVNGHPFSVENTYHDKRGRRSCRICRKDADKRKRMKRKNECR